MEMTVVYGESKSRKWGMKQEQPACWSHGDRKKLVHVTSLDFIDRCQIVQPVVHRPSAF